jgi:putative phosphoesterase
MKILIVSDTHGREKELKKVIEKTRPFDYLIHCGDTEGHESMIREMAACPCTIVRGNNDFFSGLEKEEEIAFGRNRILVVHGHQYGVSMTPEMLREEAKSRGFNIVMYGHTHRPSIDMSDPELTMLNPGSLTYPRQEGRAPSYIVMDIDRGGEPHFTLNYLR